MPLGLSQLAFTPMQYGVDLLLAIARWVAHLPHAMWVVPNPSDYGFALFALGIVWIYFWRTHWRWLGLVGAIAGMSTAFFYMPADLLVSADGKQVGARMDDGRFAMIKGRSQNMTAEQWLRAEIEQSYTDKGAVAEDCDKEGCIFKTHGHSIAVIKRSEALGDDCRASDIVISAQPVDHATCSALLIIDKPLLDAGGTAAIWFTPHGLKLTQAKSEQGKRPWVSHEGDGSD
jgi:competence protein ComEC